MLNDRAIPCTSPAPSDAVNNENYWILKEHSENPMRLRDNLLGLVQTAELLRRQPGSRVERTWPAFIEQVQSWCADLNDEQNVIRATKAIRMLDSMQWALRQVESTAIQMERMLAGQDPVLSKDQIEGGLAVAAARTKRAVILARTGTANGDDAFIKEILRACKAAKFDATSCSKIVGCCRKIRQNFEQAPWSDPATDWPFFVESLIDVIRGKGARAAMSLCSQKLRETVAKVKATVAKTTVMSNGPVDTRGKVRVVHAAARSKR